MKRWILVIGLLFVIGTFIGTLAWAGGESERIKTADKVLSTVMRGPQGDAPRYLLSHARGIILVPGLKKAGFIVGIKRGKGVIIGRDKEGKWLAPSFITISGGSLGFQAGAKSSDLVLLLMSDRAVQKFTGNKIKIGVDLGVVAGPVGKEIGLSQEDLNKVEIFSYIREKGIFAGATISGSVVSHDEKANRNFYGTSVTFKDILCGKKISLPSVASELLQTLQSFSSR